MGGVGMGDEATTAGWTDGPFAGLLTASVLRIYDDADGVSSTCALGIS